MQRNNESPAAQAIRETEEELERLSSLTSDEIRVLRENAARQFEEKPPFRKSEANNNLKENVCNLLAEVPVSKNSTTMIVVMLSMMTIVNGFAFCAPIEAVEAATEQAIEYGEHGQPFYVWCLRIVFAASIGAVTYHIITMLIKKALHSTPRGCVNEVGFPAGFVWKSTNVTIKMQIKDRALCSALPAHRWVSDDRLEQWEVLNFSIAGGTAQRDLWGGIACSDHNGLTRTLLIRRGSCNDLSLLIIFFDPAVNTIVTVVCRV